MIKRFICLLSASCILYTATAQPTPAATKEQRMEWWREARFGMFIHWGVYAVPAGTYKGQKINRIGEWIMNRGKIPVADYQQFAKEFNPVQYDADAWVRLAKEAGMKYIVITTKHHDGLALWPTKQDGLSVVKNTPAKKDLLKPFYEALDKQGIKRGAYFSLIDWSYPDYPGFLNDSNRYDAAKDPARWKKFQNFFQAQIDEVNTAYKPDLWWFDGDWEHSAEEWQSVKVRNEILNVNPNAIINGRLQGYGDYETPEQNFPVSRPKYNWWELCMTINNSWGYQPKDTAWKTPFEIITLFADVVSNGGNLLLDIGPKEDGTIPKEDVHVLEELGKWNKKHGEAIFGTVPGLPQGHFYGATTMSKDSSTIYLFLPAGATGNVMIKGMDNKINDIQILGTDQHLTHKVVGKISWSPVPGLVFIDVPEKYKDPYMTVLKLKLDKPVKLYRGQGGLN